MWHYDVEYSDVQAEPGARKYHNRSPDAWSWQEYSDYLDDMFATGYENFIAYHDRLTQGEQENYRSAISTDEKLRWAA